MKNTHEERAYNVRFNKYDIEGRDCIISTKITGDAQLGGVYKDKIANAIDALLSGNICSDKMIADICDVANELHLDFTYNLDPDIFGAILFNFDDCKGEDFSKYIFILNIAKCVDDPEDSTRKVIKAVCRHYERHNKIESKVEELYENALESIAKNKLDSTTKEYEDALLSMEVTLECNRKGFFKTKDEAVELRNFIFGHIAEYGYISIADIKQFNYETSNICANDSEKGWKSTDEIEIRQYLSKCGKNIIHGLTGSWAVVLPKPIELNLSNKDSYSIPTKLSPVDISDYIGHFGIRIRDNFSKQVAKKFAMEIREKTGYGAYAHAITTLNTNKVDEYGIFIFPIRKRCQANKILEELTRRFRFPKECWCEVLKAGELYGV